MGNLLVTLLSASLGALGQATLVVLSSGFVAALVSGLFQARAKEADYRNEFFKEVIKRRLEAYEDVEIHISKFKLSVLDTEKDPTRPYHLPFANSSQERLAELNLLLTNVMKQGLWLSEAIFDKARELNEIFFRLDSPESAIECGKAHYREIALIRADLEAQVARDMLTMHDVGRFLRSKRIASHEFKPFGVRS